MSLPTPRRHRTDNGVRRRVPLNVSLDISTIEALTAINSNRSAAIEQLVRDYLAKRRSRITDPIAAAP